MKIMDKHSASSVYFFQKPSRMAQLLKDMEYYTHHLEDFPREKFQKIK